MRLVYFLLLVFYSSNIFSQELLPNNYWFTKSSEKKITIPFQLINNTIVVPATVNGSKDTLKFIIDSGLKIPIILNKNSVDTSQMKFARNILLNGLGTKDSIIVRTTYENFLRFPGLININEYINIIDNKEVLSYFSNTSGIEINGLVGYSLLKGFVLEIDYYNQLLTFYKYNSYKKKRYWLRKKCTLPLLIENSKPYVVMKILNSKNRWIDVKFLIDTGFSQSLWLIENSYKNIICPSNNIRALLGMGLNGEVLGKICYTKALKFDNFKMHNVLTTFPDSIYYSKKTIKTRRDGSLGGEFLRRFKVILNYKDKEVTFVRNPNYKNKYKFNRTGMIITQASSKYPVFLVNKIIKKSDADKCGIKAGDIIMGMGKHQYPNLTSKEILNYLHSNYKKISITIGRDTSKIKIVLKSTKNI